MNRIVKFHLFPNSAVINDGIINKAIGIKNLKFASNVNEIEIQYKFVAKYPKPKIQPNKNDWFLLKDSFFLKI